MLNDPDKINTSHLIQRTTITRIIENFNVFLVGPFSHSFSSLEQMLQELFDAEQGLAPPRFSSFVLTSFTPKYPPNFRTRC